MKKCFDQLETKVVSFRETFKWRGGKGGNWDMAAAYL